MRRRLRGLSERDWRVIDRALVLAVLVIAELELQFVEAGKGSLALNIPFVALMVGVLWWRRSHPLLTLVAVIFLGVLGEALLTGPPDMFSQVLVIITACYSVAAHADRRPAFAGLAIASLGVIGVSVSVDPGDIFFPLVFFVIVPWTFGRVLRNQLMLARELAEKAERAEHAREEDERRAILAERGRIARELHDVLAHNLSVIVVQAGAARRIVARDPERAGEAAELIGRTGREALAELRHLLGPLRKGEGEPLSGPPSLSRLDRLIARARQAGLPVELRVEGKPVALPPGIDLTAYRVVQEGLTNALKHAGDARAKVTVRYEPWEVVLEVEDDGVGPERRAALSDAGGGHGLVGMRERVALYHGLLQAGRRRGGGFAVRARLPTVTARTNGAAAASAPPTKRAAT